MISWPPAISKRLDSIRQWWRGHRYLSIWWWEAICCITALGALLAIVATIRIHERKPLPQWRYGLTINAIIAAYTVILKAAAGLVLAEGISHLKWIAIARPQSLSTFVAHDNASRGPLGALKLLWQIQYRSGDLHVSSFIASFGALITIFILLLGPFLQQIIRTYQCELRITGDYGTIARTNVYKEVGLHSGALEATIPLGVRDAVNNGLFASRKPDAVFTCRTGNCTFANKYTSTAYCSSCRDATDQLEFEQYEEYDYLINQTMPHTNVSLRIDNNYLTLSRGGQAMTRGYPGLVSYAGSEVAIVRWDGLSAIPDQNQTVRGYRCRLYPCLKTFRATVSTGRVKEEVLEETDDIFSRFGVPYSPPVRSAADLDCLESQDQRQILKQLGYQFNVTTRWLPYNVSLANGTVENPVYAPALDDGPCEKEPGNQFPDLCIGNQTTAKALEAVPARCIYNVGITTVNSMEENLFGQMFTGIVRNAWLYGRPAYEGPEALTALYNAGSGTGSLEDLQGIMRNITDTLTTYIRQAGDKNFSQPATGEMYNHASCIQVRWAWVSYAAAIVGLLLIFFAWMVAYARINQSRLRKQWTNQHSVPLIHDFKSSALTFLFHGLDCESLKRMEGTGAANKEKELEIKAKEVTVKLVATDQGWKLSSIDS